MMKKSKFLALALSGAIMVMGAGYAAWTDQVTINNTVNTGQIDLYFVDLPQELTLDSYVGGDVTYDVLDGTDMEEANVEITNMYPGADATVNLQVKNDSTIPVKVESINPTGDISKFDLSVRVTYTKIDGTTGTFTASGDLSTAQINEQIKENSVLDIEYTLTAHDDVDENAIYTFGVAPVFGQYNL